VKVLLVDDEEELVYPLAERLCLRGIDATGVTTCLEALRVAEHETFDLAVLDMQMPKMTGIELKKKLAEKCPEMKFMMVTGHGSEKYFEVATAEDGVVCYLVKPVDIEVLVREMKKVLK
jgi:DNA-binding response OmpR family regulator